VPKTSKGPDSSVMEIQPLGKNSVDIAIIYESPLIFNRMAVKVQRGLLLPSGRKNAAERAASLKHDPIEEFRASPYRLKSDKEPTLVGIPAGAFKKAMAQAAIDIPGAAKAQIGRLTRVLALNDENLIPIYGIPYLKMDVTRSADIAHTPDVRTRACIKRWAAVLTVTYTTPNLTQKTIVNLCSGAGEIIGVGDWRQEKGSGDFGLWRITDGDDPEFRQILTEGGRAAQQAALDNPMPYDIESEDLLAWYQSELVRRRGTEGEQRATTSRKRKAAEEAAEEAEEADSN
jgi:hypothetical protein